MTHGCRTGSGGGLHVLLTDYRRWQSFAAAPAYAMLAGKDGGK